MVVVAVVVTMAVDMLQGFVGVFVLVASVVLNETPSDFRRPSKATGLNVQEPGVARGGAGAGGLPDGTCDRVKMSRRWR
jgi:hypothetical protein